MVDAPASGAGVCMDVEVRVLFWAPRILAIYLVYIAQRGYSLQKGTQMVVKKELNGVAAGETPVADSGDALRINQKDDQMLIKLPLYTERKADGIYRYRRRVPAKVVDAVGKGYLYRNLGKTKEAVLANWPGAHEEIEALLKSVESNARIEAKVFAEASERDKVLHLVEKHYGEEAC